MAKVEDDRLAHDQPPERDLVDRRPLANEMPGGVDVRADVAVQREDGVHHPPRLLVRHDIDALPAQEGREISCQLAASDQEQQPSGVDLGLHQREQQREPSRE